MGDVVQYVPGVSMAQGEGNRDTPILRGSASTADFFVDGIRDDVQYFRDVYNVDRVEALKGPNAMIFGRGRRRELLQSLDRSVTLQVSLDSATPDLHDRQRGAGSWARALEGIGQARALGFRVRVAATLYDEDRAGVTALHHRLDAEGIAPDDRLIRPVAEEGFADTGVHVSIDTLEPEPTITADGAWWHPVAVTNPHLRIADAPLPLSEVFGVVRDTLAVQDAAARAGREVFLCA